MSFQEKFDWFRSHAESEQAKGIYFEWLTQTWPRPGPIQQRLYSYVLTLSGWAMERASHPIVLSALAIGVSGPISLAYAEVVTLFKGPVWEASVDQDKYYGMIGRTEAVTAAGPKVREFAFFFNIKDRRFGVLIEKENLQVPRGTQVPVVVAFRPSQPSKPLQTLRFNARVASGQVTTLLSDADVAVWTHNITSGSAMTVSFPTKGPEQWTFDLAGTTPAISAMAAAIGAAGITDLPPPWRAEGYGAPANSQPVDRPRTPSDAQEAIQAQKRQLAIATLEAEKAKAEAERARAEAVKARADADRAQAEAQVIADAKAKAAEETRATALRVAADERRKAEQAKAESDAKGVEP